MLIHGSTPARRPRTPQVVEKLVKALGCRLFLDGMRTHINLSRRPFKNRRLFWIGLTAAYFLGLWLFLWMISEKSRVVARQTEVSHRIETQREEVADALREEERRRLEQVKIVLSDDQKMQLASARQLIHRKEFSWNRMLSDIEEYIPKNTRIMSIKVEGVISSSEDLAANLQVKALGTTPDELTAMMLNLEKSNGRFIVGETGQDPTAESGETPFTISLIYRPSKGGGQ